MTAVFVHGVPETTAIWGPLVAAVDREDVALLALPGFGTALPDGFEPTMYRYADWIAEQLAGFDEVDLVAHDWGALAAAKVLAAQPTNVRSWVLDIGDLDDDFEWHDTAKLWQTPGDGEAFIEGWLAASPEERGQLLEGVGAPPEAGLTMGRSLDATMGACILSLYRSAVDIGVEWGPGVDDIRGRGLVVRRARDAFRSPERIQSFADRTGAQVLELAESGHWWMWDEPEVVAAALAELWASA